MELVIRILRRLHERLDLASLERPRVVQRDPRWPTLVAHVDELAPAGVLIPVDEYEVESILCTQPRGRGAGGGGGGGGGASRIRGTRNPKHK